MASPKRHPRYIAILAVSSILILSLGNWLRPKRGTEEGPAQPPSEIARLQGLTQRRSIDQFSEYFAELSTRLESYVLRIENGERSAVAWEGNRAVSAGGPGAPPPTDTARNAQRAWPAAVVFAAPHLPAALFEIDRTNMPPPLQRFDGSLYQRGAWTIALWRLPGGGASYATGQFVAVEVRQCYGIASNVLETTLPLTAEMLGAGVFDLDGALMGLIGTCEKSLVAYDVETVDAALSQMLDFDARMLARFGIRVDPLDPKKAGLPGADRGMVIMETWKGYQGEAAGLGPGDVIVEVDGRTVTSAMDLEPLVLPVAREVFDLRIVRAGRPRLIQLRARGGDPDKYHFAGIAWKSSEPGLLIGDVQPGSLLASCGARPDDRLVSVNGRRLESVEQAAPALLALEKEGGHLVLGRGPRLWGTFLTHE